MPFIFEKQEIEDVIIIKPLSFGDSRGVFLETYKKSDFIKNGIKDDFLQDNYSKSHKNVLRGLHFQKKPYEQSKLLRCIKGEILDIVIDIRPKSKTFKKYLKFNLSESNNNILYIPKGFAHGFYVLSDIAEISYKASVEYNKEYDCGIIWDDYSLKIDWNIKNPILSEKDKNLATLDTLIKEGVL